MPVTSHPAFDGHEMVHFAHDPATGLRAIIAVHASTLGPGAGGVRMWNYTSEEAAIRDVLRLSRGMSYKNAMAELPLGGGKAVIIGDARRDKSTALFEAYGRVVHSLGGHYITAEDVGMSVADMQTIATQTPYVSGLPPTGGAAGGDPSPKTAIGIFHGIRAAVRHALKRDDIAGLRVAVQGLGNVGMHLCRHLHEAGAKLIVADIHSEPLQRARDAYDATVVPVEEILSQDVDLLAPCALGGVLNADSIPRIRARIIAGGANNQLLEDADGRRLHERGILYAPDYVINAGGIINVAAEYLKSMDDAAVDGMLAAIGPRLEDIFATAQREDRPANEIADAMARARIGR